MKKLFIIPLLLIGTTGFGQKIELSAQLYADAFHYRGASAVSNSFIIQAGNDANNYTNNPYGKQLALGFGAGLQAQLVARKGFIIGLQTGYEQLSSKVNINQVWPYSTTRIDINYTYYTPTTGQTYLKSYFININPYAGYRFKIRRLSLDILPGLDLGVPVSTSLENGKATANDNALVYKTRVNRGKPPVDFRTQSGLALHYKQFGLQASYARGSTNYEQNVIGDNGNYVAKSELFRLGLSYQVL